MGKVECPAASKAVKLLESIQDYLHAKLTAVSFAKVLNMSVKFGLHRFGQRDPEMTFDDKSGAAFARLRVDPDEVRGVVPEILWVDAM